MTADHVTSTLRIHLAPPPPQLIPSDPFHFVSYFLFLSIHVCLLFRREQPETRGKYSRQSHDNTPRTNFIDVLATSPLSRLRHRHYGGDLISTSVTRTNFLTRQRAPQSLSQRYQTGKIPCTQRVPEPHAWES